ncbi:MAG: pyruvate, phosphate dikinase [bacterium]
MSTQDIFAFDDPWPANLDPTALLGGKGANLMEMVRQLQLPVPPGFVITTNVCRRFLEDGWPEGLEADIAGQLVRLGQRLGQTFGDASSPLLVSVRSGAPISMPGMMDTLLNVGMTPAIREQIAKASGNREFAADTWLRFNRMYADVVLGVSKQALDEAAASDGSEGGILAAAERIRALGAAADAGGIPLDPLQQVYGAVAAVFNSWQCERARVFREKEGISELLGTAVTVQAMVFGNLNAESGTGVVFTRDPTTGEAKPYGDYLAMAQGEDVVAGTHAVSGLEALRQQLPQTYDALIAALDRLEHHYRDMCDVEFTVCSGELFILQTRVGRRSPLAAARIAVEMASDPDFPLSRAEAVERVDQEILRKLVTMVQIDPAAEAIGSGLAASPGVGVGELCLDPDRAADLAAAGAPVILVREETSPADVHGMVASAGLVTLRGGVASHAAVVARGWSIPAITSLRDASVASNGLTIAGRVIAPGTTITVDGGSGSLFLGDRRGRDSADVAEARLIRDWAAELGVEPGTPSGPAAAPARTMVDLFEIARTVALKGLCSAERAASALGAEERYVQDLIAGNESFFRTTTRGMMVTPAGHAWIKENLEKERAGASAPGVDACYRRFLLLNAGFKQLVSGWQMSTADGFTPEGLAGLAAEVESLHANFLPILSEMSGYFRRLSTFQARFERALAELRAGDASMLASPMKDSYHTVWFEYHEELIALSGRDRAVEEAAEAGH